MGRISFGVAVLAATLISGSAWAEMLQFHATMTGKSEVPPKVTKGNGEVLATLNTTTKMLTYTVTYADLSGPATMGHFHGPALPGHNAGVAVPFNKATVSPDHGSAKLTDKQIADLEAGKWYANVHTHANPGGEIRGQMEEVK